MLVNLKHKIAKHLSSPRRLISEFNLYIDEKLQKDIPDIDCVRNEISPIFVIGVNRSGTSIMSYLLSQHPDVEGLYNGNDSPLYYKSGHSNAYCESMHIWEHLMPTLLKGYATCWGLPEQISRTYRNRAKNKAEKRRLAYDLLRYRMTDKTSLLKNNLNTLRIGLIADVFPKARFIYICRGVEDFMSSSIDKWRNDESGTLLQTPAAGLHWHLINLVARYDLETYARGRYEIVWLEKLNESEKTARELFSSINSFLSLKTFDFDFSEVESHWGENKVLKNNIETPSFPEITKIVEFELKLLKHHSFISNK